MGILNQSDINQALAFLQTHTDGKWKENKDGIEANFQVNTQIKSEAKACIKKKFSSLLEMPISSKDFSYSASLQTGDGIIYYDVAIKIINPELIKKLALQQEKDVLEKVKDSIQKDPYSATKIIKEFGITNQKTLFEIAKLCIQTHPLTMQYIDQFGIESQDDLIELANLCFEKNSLLFFDNIKKFNIKKPEGLIFLAKLWAKKEANKIAENIQKFGIKDQGALSEIAKLCASQYENNVPLTIERFGIKDKNTLIEIAKLCAVHSKHTASAIKNFGISDQKTLIEIAMLIAENSPHCMGRYIKYFNIEDQEALVMIAKEMAKKGAIMYQIEHYNIKNESDLIEIAKLCAKNNDSAAKYIRYFGITNQDALLEIAKICAQIGPCSLAGAIKHFGIKDEKILREIGEICIRKEGFSIVSEVKKFGITLNESLLKLVENKDNPRFSCNEACAVLRQYLKEEFQQPFLADQLQAIEESENGEIKKERIYQIAESLFLIKTRLNDEQIEKLYQQKIAEAALSFGITELRVSLMKKAIKCAENPAYEAVRQSLTTSKGDYPWQRITRMLLAELQLEGVDKATIERVIAKTEKGETEFYKGANSQIFIELLLILTRQDSLRGKEWEFKLRTLKWNEEDFEKNLKKETEQKQSLLERIFDEASKSAIQRAIPRVIAEGNMAEGKLAKAQMDGTRIPASKKKAWEQQIRAKIQAEDLNNPTVMPTTAELSDESITTMNSVLSLIRFDAIRKLTQPEQGETIKAAEESAFRKIIPIGNVKNFNTQFQTIFQESRGPRAITTYAAEIKSLADPLSLSCLADFVTETLNGTFREHRYALENNPHLATINSKFPEVITAWQEKIPDFAVKLDDNAVPFSGEQVIAWLHTKLIIDQHLDLETYNLTFLKAFLECSADKREEIIVQFRQHGEQEEVSLREKKEKELKLTLKNLRLQELCLFCLKSEPAQQKSRINQLMRFLDSEQLLLTPLSIVEDKILSYKEVKSWLEELLRNLNLENNKLVFLQQVLSEDISDLPFLQKQLSEARTNTKKARILKTAKEQEAINCLKMQEYAFQLVAGKVPEHQKGILSQISLLLKTAPFYKPNQDVSEFNNDVHGMILSLQEKLQAPTLTAVDSDDPIDLLLSGTEVSGSCQRIGGSPSLNKGLLGYMMDGKNRMFALKDSNNGTVARCFGRLLWDGEKAVLFKDRIYPDYITLQQASALNEIAMKKAEALGVPLVSCDGLGEQYEKQLQALGGPAPWEYCDGTGQGISAKGIYTIETSRYFLPR